MQNNASFTVMPVHASPDFSFHLCWQVSRSHSPYSRLRLKKGSFVCGSTWGPQGLPLWKVSLRLHRAELWHRPVHSCTFPRTTICFSELLPEHSAFNKKKEVCYWAGRWMTPDVVVYSVWLLTLSWGPLHVKAGVCIFCFKLVFSGWSCTTYIWSTVWREGRWRGFKITCQAAIRICGNSDTQTISKCKTAVSKQPGPRQK